MINSKTILLAVLLSSSSAITIAEECDVDCVIERMKRLEQCDNPSAESIARTESLWGKRADSRALTIDACRLRVETVHRIEIEEKLKAKRRNSSQPSR